MKKKKKKSLEELIPDAELGNRVSEQLYSGRPPVSTWEPI